MDKLTQAREALNWYAEQADAMHRYMTAKPPNDTGMVAVAHALSLDFGKRATDAISALSDGEAVEPVAQFLPMEDGEFNGNIVPEGCTGSALVFSEGVLHVGKDGSGYIAIDEEHFNLEDDRCEGPDGPEGSVHWITRFPPGELQALRDFLNGVPRASHGAVRVSKVAVAGWNACRKSIYAVCEDVQSEADRLQLSSKPGTASEEQHAKGYYAGSRYAAKSIARGFCAMDARDDDNLVAALASLEPAAPKTDIRKLIADVEAGRVDGFLDHETEPNDTALACPYCDGSGHKDDVSPPTGKDAVQAVTEEWPVAPHGWTVSPPSYHSFPLYVSRIGGEWYLRRHHDVAGVSSTISVHDTAKAALAAVLQQKETGRHGADVLEGTEK
ncbi:hypothetical protein [Mesorhizobium sp. CAU 1741]|uniref:hypothetical protein n=1 Tax=Mesorhizobium sp. CAU 1741 TaxID=3140366 RepID=UPI00325ACB51